MKKSEFLNILSKSNYIEFLKEKGKVSSERKPGLELHHIYPRKFEEGEISKDNTILLSSQDHLIAHVILVQSLEKVKATADKDYIQAVLAVNFLFNTNWTRLSEQEKHNLIDKVPDIARIRLQALEEAHKKAKEPESLEKLKRTNLQRYGHVRGKLDYPEVRKKAAKNSKQTKEQLYGNPVGKALLPENIKKSQNTRLVRYGDSMPGCHTPEVQKKAAMRSRESKLNMYGSGIGKAGLEEYREKARVTKRKKQTVVRTPEFLEWWKIHRKNYSQRNFAVYDYLKEVGKTLEEFQEFKKN